jgi:hypothetical protein
MQSDKKNPVTVSRKRSNAKSNDNAKANTNNKSNDKRYYKKNESSDDDDDAEEDASDVEEDESESEEKVEEDKDKDKKTKKEEKFDKKKYISMLAEMFPSKHMSERVKQMEKNDAISKKREAFKKWSDKVKKPLVETKKQQQQVVETKKQQQQVVETKKQQPIVKRRRLKKIILSESEASESEASESEASESEASKSEASKSEASESEASESESSIQEEDDSDSSYREEEDASEADESEEEEEEEEEDNKGLSNLSKYNIILSVGNPGSRRNNQDDYFEDDYFEDDEEEDDEEKSNDHQVAVYNEKEAEALASLKKMVSSLTEKEKKNKTIMKMLADFEKREKAYNKGFEKHVSKLKEKNTRKLSNLMSEKNVMNDVKYFHEKMTVEEQHKVLNQMIEIKSHCTIVKPYRLTLLDADIPVQYKAIAYKKISTLKYMEPGGGEYYKIKNWVDTFMHIPFGKTKNLPVTIDDGVEKCHEFMENANKILDEAVYGLDDVKLQIMQMVGQWISNPKAMGTAIAIKGPMGTGKTSLVKEGISKILGREFAFIALGGATDSSFLEGHSYTYEGSTWGKIVDILVKCKSMNPVIFFDELDKVSDTAKGEEIIGILTHLTDSSQNSKFHDKYFSELEFDLSKCLFIFSYNDERKVNPILKDRMYRIETKGYDAPEKFIISKDYLLPKICEQVKFAKEDIVIPEETIKYLITNHTDGEQGVRNLKRCLEIIYTKLNLYRLMKPGSNLFKKEMSLDIKFPMTITTDIVDKLIKKNENDNWTHRMMYL